MTEQAPTLTARDADAERDLSTRADELVEAFYRGLGVGTGALTRSILARERSIARQLVAAGATPAEAETYARNMASVPNRLAPIDLRSFERERPTWTARNGRAAESQRRYIDRTGQGIDDCVDGPPSRAPSAALASPTEDARVPDGPATASGPSEPDTDSSASPLKRPTDWTRAVRRRLEGAD